MQLLHPLQLLLRRVRSIQEPPPIAPNGRTKCRRTRITKTYRSRDLPSPPRIFEQFPRLVHHRAARERELAVRRHRERDVTLDRGLDDARRTDAQLLAAAETA
jgi:hypothetical protein